MDEEQFFLIRKNKGEITCQQKFSCEELKKSVVEAIVYARARDSRANSHEKYHLALQKINKVIWNKNHFPSKEAEKRRNKK